MSAHDQTVQQLERPKMAISCTVWPLRQNKGTKRFVFVLVLSCCICLFLFLFVLFLQRSANRVGSSLDVRSSRCLHVTRVSSAFIERERSNDVERLHHVVEAGLAGDGVGESVVAGMIIVGTLEKQNCTGGACFGCLELLYSFARCTTPAHPLFYWPGSRSRGPFLAIQRTETPSLSVWGGSTPPARGPFLAIQRTETTFASVEAMIFASRTLPRYSED